MPQERLIMTLAKVLIAAAWIDGDLSHDEVNSMKDLLWRLPQLSARDWASLQIYIDSPVGDAERARLVADLQDAIRTSRDQALILDALDEMMRADGEVTDEEERVASEIRAAVESVNVGLLSQLIKAAAARRSQATASAPNREDFLDDYLRNRVYYAIRRRLDMGEAELDLGDEVLRTLSLAGGLMAQIAHVQPDVTDAQVRVMVEALRAYWHLTPEQAAFAAGVAISETASLMDPYRLARRFAEKCTYQERAEFLEVLFAVAAADGDASHDEIEEIRAITRSLKLSHEDFIAAKLKVLHR
ncbi:MAG: TerB family tellurite resistance protein [Anaerolineae bacterium]